MNKLSEYYILSIHSKMDLFKMANDLAKNMSDSDKEAIEGMDMEKMISHVTQNVFKMMGNSSGGDSMPDISQMMGSMFGGGTLGGNIGGIEPVKEHVPFPKTRDISFELNVDLEDFYNGKKKKLELHWFLFIDFKIFV
jgi:DnaJ-class molecular chaperone